MCPAHLQHDSSHCRYTQQPFYWSDGVIKNGINSTNAVGRSSSGTRVSLKSRDATALEIFIPDFHFKVLSLWTAPKTPAEVQLPGHRALPHCQRFTWNSNLYFLCRFWYWKLDSLICGSCWTDFISLDLFAHLSTERLHHARNLWTMRKDSDVVWMTAPCSFTFVKLWNTLFKCSFSDVNLYGNVFESL